MGRQPRCSFFFLAAVYAVILAASDAEHEAGEQQRQPLSVTTKGSDQSHLIEHPVGVTSDGHFVSLHAVFTVAAVVTILAGVWCWRRRRTKGLEYSAVESASSGRGEGDGDGPESVWKQATTPEGKTYWFHTETDEVRWSAPPAS